MLSGGRVVTVKGPLSGVGAIVAKGDITLDGGAEMHGSGGCTCLTAKRVIAGCELGQHLQGPDLRQRNLM